MARGLEKCECCGVLVGLMALDAPITIIDSPLGYLFVAGDGDGDMVWFEPHADAKSRTLYLVEHTKERCDAHRRRDRPEAESETG